jgi:hypothetical protein
VLRHQQALERQRQEAEAALRRRTEAAAAEVQAEAAAAEAMGRAVLVEALAANPLVPELEAEDFLLAERGGELAAAADRYKQHHEVMGW